ncbi:MULTISPECIES: oligopeptide:H+ symporter [unclassified Bifidobacterium]|uniref:peptide MFS transporter n=1 Tax=unclassified Bifidobacterium TaxID=2608897 RepID=UPI0023F85D1C|nr:MULTISPECIES: oligopeptide:H+ symporter [unclassified Bifidobacterium]WEV65250.1 oligopeptide:H+ symporter [Bifidobacterium sp. ESL0764]WEV75947.1 oligopeptide:H+ symporter [Bifidobacterium sp. ESL0800]
MKKERTFLGHPLGMGVLSVVQFGKGFANYGVSSILIYYLYKQAAQGGLGFSEDVASQLTTVYTTLSLLAGLLGGYLADRFFGLQRAMFWGNLSLFVGWALLAVPHGGIPFYFASQVVLLIGFACMGSAQNALVGRMYSKDDPKRDTGFGMLYVVSNVGAISPMITGAIAMAFNYNAGFALAALVQGVCFLTYALLHKKVFGDIGAEPTDPFPPEQKKKDMTVLVVALVVVLVALIVLFATGILTAKTFSNGVSTISVFIPFVYIIYIVRSKKTNGRERVRMGAFVIFFIGVALTGMIFYLSTSVLAVYAEKNVNTTLFGIHFSPASFQTASAIFAVVFGSFFSWLWQALDRHQPSTAVKFGVGVFCYGFGPLFMAIPLSMLSNGGRQSPMWLIAFYAIITIGEAIVSPLGGSVSSKLAPQAFLAQVVTVWNLVNSTGSGMATLSINFYQKGHESMFFIVIGVLTCLVGFIIWLFRSRLNKMLE